MARIKGAMMTRKRRNKTLKLAKGYWGSKSKHFKMAKQDERHQLLPVHERLQEGWHHPEPQDAV